MSLVPTIAAQIGAILVDALNVSPHLIKPEADFYADLAFDSIDHVELVIALEDHFDLDQISDDEAERIRTVADAISCVERHQRVPA